MIRKLNFTQKKYECFCKFYFTLNVCFTTKKQTCTSSPGLLNNAKTILIFLVASINCGF